MTRLQDGRTWLAYKPEHAVDLDTDAIVAAEIQPADCGDTTTLDDTLEAAVRGLDAAGWPPTIRIPAELTADKGLAGDRWRTRIAEPKPKEVQHWRGDPTARRAVYGNRARPRSRVGREALALRAEKVERSFALTRVRGGLRRDWLRGWENVQKRYFVHLAAYNLGLVMRQLIGAGTPKEPAARAARPLWLLDPDIGLLVLLILPPEPITTLGLVVPNGRPIPWGPTRLVTARRLSLQGRQVLLWCV